MEFVHCLDYFTIVFIDTEAELGLGLILGSSWFLEGNHIYSPEICAWLFPLPCLTAKPCSLSCGNSMEFHSCCEGKDLVLQSLWHDFHGRWQSTFPQHPGMHRGIMASSAAYSDLAMEALERGIFHPVLQDPVGPQFSKSASGAESPRISGIVWCTQMAAQLSAGSEK